MKGSINQRANGTFTVVAEPTYDPAKGKVTRPSLGTVATREEAERIQLRYNAEIADGVFSLDAATLRGTKLSWYLDDWLEEIAEQEQDDELKRLTVRDYEGVVRLYIRPHLGRYRISQIDVPMLKKWLRRLRRQGLADRTVQKAYRTLHRAFADSVLPVNPARLPKRVRPKVRDRRTMVVPSTADVRAFLRHTAECERPYGRRLHPVWTFLATTGVRRSEVCGLTWDDIDLSSEPRTATIRRAVKRDGAELIVESPKSKASKRTISIDQTVRSLKALRAAEAARRLRSGVRYNNEPLGLSLVFRWRDEGKPTNPDNLTWAFKKEWEHAQGLEGVTLHGLRRSLGSALLLQGNSVVDVAAHLGHTPDVLLRVYATELDEVARLKEMSTAISEMYPPTPMQ